MNIDNIKRAIKLMESIPECRIDTEEYRVGERPYQFARVCRTNGSVIGFSTELDTKKHLRWFMLNRGLFNYKAWGEDFFGVSSSSIVWEFMFKHLWSNNKEQIIKRMQWIADGNEVPTAFSKCMDYKFIIK